MYYKQVVVIEARQQQYAIEAVGFPNMKANDRRTISRRYQRILESNAKITPQVAEESWAFLRNQKRKKAKPKVSL